jgi:hypothetical protein
MNYLAWNCRGLGNLRTVQELARLVRAKDPSVVFLIETWQDDGPLERLRCQLQFENKFVANSRNKGGGLCLFWKQEVNLRVSSFSPSHIDAIINENQDDPGDSRASMEHRRLRTEKNHGPCFEDSTHSTRYLGVPWGTSTNW